MSLTIGIITDLHFGPEARHEGKLRKLTHHAAELTRDFIAEMNDRVKPDLVVNLGDDIEDSTKEQDVARYGECQSILRGAKAPLINVAGNHDTVNITRDDLLKFWQRTGHLYYSFDQGGFHFAVLHTIERTDIDIRLPAPQLEWLREDLRQTTLPVLVLMHHSASEQRLEDSMWFAGREHVALVKDRAELRRILEESGKVRAVFNGHVHRNNLDVIGGIPYVTFQSLIENLDDDAPGRPSAAHGVVEIDEARMIVRVRGNDPARYQIERG